MSDSPRIPPTEWEKDESKWVLLSQGAEGVR